MKLISMLIALTGVTNVAHSEPTLLLELAGPVSGTVEIDLASETAPNHIQRITDLVNSGRYDDVVFHRILEDFSVSTGDFENGKIMNLNLEQLGRSSSSLLTLQAEITNHSFKAGDILMDRGNELDSATSQFSILISDARFLDNGFTYIGRVTSGLNLIKEIPSIELGDFPTNPAYILSAQIKGNGQESSRENAFNAADLAVFDHFSDSISGVEDWIYWLDDTVTIETEVATANTDLCDVTITQTYTAPDGKISIGQANIIFSGDAGKSIRTIRTPGDEYTEFGLPDLQKSKFDFDSNTIVVLRDGVFEDVGGNYFGFRDDRLAFGFDNGEFKIIFGNYFRHCHGD